MPKPPPIAEFDDLDASGWDPRFEDEDERSLRPTLSVSWFEIDGQLHADGDGTSPWALGKSASSPFALEGTKLSPADATAFAEGTSLYPGFSARYTLVHRIAGFPVLRVLVELDGNGAIPDEDVVRTVLRKSGGEVHDVFAHVDFAPVLSKVCAVVLSEVARFTVNQILDSKRSSLRKEG